MIYTCIQNEDLVDVHVHDDVSVHNLESKTS